MPNSNEDILLSVGIDTTSLTTARLTIQRELGGILIPVSISGVDQKSLTSITKQIGTASLANEKLMRAQLQTEGVQIQNQTKLERLAVARLKTTSAQQKINEEMSAPDHTESNKRTEDIAKGLDLGNKLRNEAWVKDLYQQKAQLEKLGKMQQDAYVEDAKRTRQGAAYIEKDQRDREESAARHFARIEESQRQAIVEENSRNGKAALKAGKQQEDAYIEDIIRSKRSAAEILKDQQSGQLKSEQAKAAWIARLGKTQDKANIENRERNQKLLEEQEKVANAPNRTIAEFGSALKWGAIFTIIYTGIRALKAGVVGTVQEMIAVDEAATLLKRDLDLTGESLNTGLNQAMMDAVLIGHRYGQSMTNVITVQDRFAKQGLSLTDIAKATDAVLLGAATTLMTTADMAQVASVAMKTFGLSTDQLSGMMDKLNETSRHYNVTAADLAQGLLHMGGSAKQVGLDLNTSIGLITGITEATGRSGGEIGNALRTMSAFIYRSDTIRGLEHLGIAVRTANDEGFRPFNDILLSIAKRWNTFTDAEQENIVQLTGGALRREHMLAIMQQYPTIISAIVTAQNSYLSSMREMSIMMDTVSFKSGQLRNSFQALATTAGEMGGLSLIKNTLDALDAIIRHLNMSWMGLSMEQRRFIEGTISIQQKAMIEMGRISERISAPSQAFGVISGMIDSGLNLLDNKKSIMKSLEGVTSISQADRDKLLNIKDQKELYIALIDILKKLAQESKTAIKQVEPDIKGITKNLEEEENALLGMITQLQAGTKSSDITIPKQSEALKRQEEAFRVIKDNKQAISFLEAMVRDLDKFITKIKQGGDTAKAAISDMDEKMANLGKKKDVIAPFRFMSDAIIQYEASIQRFNKLSTRFSGISDTFSDKNVRNATELLNIQEAQISGFEKEIDAFIKQEREGKILGELDLKRLTLLLDMKQTSTEISNILFGKFMQAQANKFFDDLVVEDEKLNRRITKMIKDFSQDITLAPTDSEMRLNQERINSLDTQIEKDQELTQIIKDRKTATRELSDVEKNLLLKLEADIITRQREREDLSQFNLGQRIKQYNESIDTFRLIAKSRPIDTLFGSEAEKEMERSKAAISEIQGKLRDIQVIEQKTGELSIEDIILRSKKIDYQNDLNKLEFGEMKLRLYLLDRESLQTRDKLLGYNQEIVLVNEINRLLKENKPDEAFSKQIELIQLKMEQISKFSGAISETIVSSLDTTKMRQPLKELGNSLKSIFSDIVKEDITNQLSASMGKSLGILDGFEKGSLMTHDAIISAFMESEGIIMAGGIPSQPGGNAMMNVGGFALNAPPSTGIQPSWWSQYGASASVVGMSALSSAQTGQWGNTLGSLAGLGVAYGAGLGPPGMLVGAILGGILGSLFGGKHKQEPTPVKEPMLEIVHRDLEYVNRNLVALRKPMELFALPSSYYFSQRPMGGVQVQGVTVNVYGIENASQMSDAITTAVAQGFTVSSKRVYQGV